MPAGRLWRGWQGPRPRRSEGLALARGLPALTDMGVGKGSSQLRARRGPPARRRGPYGHVGAEQAAFSAFVEASPRRRR